MTIPNEVLRALHSRRLSTRERAVAKLADIGTRAAARPLVGLADDTNALVRARVAEALASFPGASTERLLIRFLSDADDLVRLNAAESLGVVASEKAADALLAMARDDCDDLVRAYAVEALGAIGAGDARIRKALRAQRRIEKAESVQLRLAEALYLLGDRSRWREIIGFLNADDYRVRSAAAAILEGLDSPRRRKHIREALEKRLTLEETRAVKERLREILAALKPM